VWLPDGEKFEDMFSLFERMLACDGHTDKHANSGPDGQTSCDYIHRATHSIARLKVYEERLKV